MGFGCNFKNSIFKLALFIGTFRASFDKIIRWMTQDLADDKSTLVQIMAWCRQATSHYLNQYGPISLSPNGVTRQQWFKDHYVQYCISRMEINIKLRQFEPQQASYMYGNISTCGCISLVPTKFYHDTHYDESVIQLNMDTPTMFMRWFYAVACITNKTFFDHQRTQKSNIMHKIFANDQTAGLRNSTWQSHRGNSIHIFIKCSDGNQSTILRNCRFCSIHL